MRKPLSSRPLFYPDLNKYFQILTLKEQSVPLSQIFSPFGKGHETRFVVIVDMYTSLEIGVINHSLISFFLNLQKPQGVRKF